MVPAWMTPPTAQPSMPTWFEPAKVSTILGISLLSALDKARIATGPETITDKFLVVKNRAWMTYGRRLRWFIGNVYGDTVSSFCRHSCGLLSTKRDVGSVRP